MSTSKACPDWLDSVSAYLDGALDAQEEHRVHEHLRHCPACAEFLVDLVPVVQALRALPPVAPSRDLWPELARELRQSPVFAGAATNTRLAPFLKRRGMAVAGLAIVASLGVVFLGRSPSPASPMADLNLYWHQHALYSHDEGVPSLYAPELAAIESSYQLDRP